MEQVRAEPDPRRVIELWMRSGREIFGRVAPIMGVVRDATGADPDMAAQWQINQDQRATAFRVLAQLLTDRGVLKQDLSIDDARARRTPCRSRTGVKDGEVHTVHSGNHRAALDLRQWPPASAITPQRN